MGRLRELQSRPGSAGSRPGTACVLLGRSGQGSLGGVILGPEAGALVYTKAVLLVYDGKTELMELDPLLNEGVGSNYNVQRALLQLLEYLASLFGLCAAGQKCNLYICSLEELLNTCKMLVCKHFSWRHDTGLVTVIYRDERE